MGWPWVCLLAVMGVWAGCAPFAEWPPAPKNRQEKLVVESALRAVRQIDDWTDAACVVERTGNEWRVKAWKIVYPEAKGRKKCVPWAVRSITVDAHGRVIGYEN